jgi:diketogulonate reductase-like aldo/keto reductase
MKVSNFDQAQVKRSLSWINRLKDAQQIELNTKLKTSKVTRTISSERVFITENVQEGSETEDIICLLASVC